MMNSKIFINLLSVVFFACTLFVTVPAMAQIPIKGMQLALNKISAEDADAALDDVSPENLQKKVKEPKQEVLPQSIQPEVKKPKQDDSPQSVQQEVQELKREVQRMRDENEARKRLEVPEEEKSKSVEDILSAVSRQYTLLKKGTIGLGYTFGYSYYSGDVINEAAVPFAIERRSSHNIANIIDTEYAILNNLTISANVPFIYKYNKVGTSSSQDATDIGDIALGLQWQPIKAGGKLPTTILSAGVTIPTGSSPYKIDPDQSLPTGNGYYSFSGGVSLSKTLDPLVAFGNLSYSYGLPVSGLSQVWGTSNNLIKVEPGSSIGFALGFGYALSYQASLNISTQFNYAFGSRYTFSNVGAIESGSSVSSTFNVGTGWRVTPTRSIYLTLSIGLTVNDPDFALAARVPFEF
jgi:HAMP domain-containing protein